MICRLRGGVFFSFLVGSSILFAGLNLHAQTDTEFWFVVPETNRYHNFPNPPCSAPGTDGRAVFLKFTSMDLDAHVTITMAATGNLLHSFTMPANSFHVVNVGNWVNDGPTSIENRLLYTTSDAQSINRSDKGLLIQSTTPVTVYYEISLPYNKELLSLKGRNALGRQFMVPFQTRAPQPNIYNCPQPPYNSFDILSTEENTRVRIHAPYEIFVWPNTFRPANVPFDIILNKGQTAIIAPYDPLQTLNYKVHRSNRLAGTYVEVIDGGDIAINTLDDLVYMPPSPPFGGSVDYIADQLIPFDHLGTDYAIVRGQSAQDHAYVVATMNGTRVYVDDVFVTTINARQSYEIPLNNNITTIRSSQAGVDGETEDKPVYVYHVSGYGNQFAGAVIPTISVCTGSSQVAFSRSTEWYDGNFFDFDLNILIRNDAIGHFILFEDGVNVTATKGAALNLNDPATYTPVPGVYGAHWSYARIRANNFDVGTAYMLRNTEDVFHLGIMNGAHGADAFYGYFSDFNEFSPTAYVVETGSQGGRICHGETVQLYVTGGSKHLWSPTDFLSDPTISAPMAINVTNSITYQVHASGACGLSGSRTIILQVADPLTASFSPDEFAGCAVPENPGDIPTHTFTFTNNSSGDYFRTWRYSLGETGIQTQFATGDNSGFGDPADIVTLKLENDTDTILEYYVTLNISDPNQFCFRELKKRVLVYPYIDVEPVAVPDDGCQPLSVDFEANPVGHFSGAFYTWEFGDGGTSNLQDPGHIYSNISPPYDPVIFTAGVTIMDQWNFCSVTRPVDVTVQPFIGAGFVVNQIEGCSPLDATVTNNSTGGITEWRWYLNGVLESITSVPPDMSSLVNNRADNLPEEYTLQLVVGNAFGCTDTLERTVRVFPNPQAAIDVTPLPDVSCSPLLIDYEALALVNADSYTWLLDGTPISNQVSGTYTLDNFSATPVTRQVWLTASNQWGCSFTSPAVDIDVYPYTEALIVIDDEEGCSPHTVTFTNASSVGTTAWEWDIGDNGTIDFSTRNITPQTFTNTTTTLDVLTIPVRLTVLNQAGCVSTEVRNITVNPGVTADFTVAMEDMLGNPVDPLTDMLCSPVTADFTGIYTNAESYQWQFGDLGGSTQADPAAIVLSNTTGLPKNIEVTLNASNSFGCSAPPVTRIYEIQPELSASFGMDVSGSCAPVTVDVDAVVVPGATYTWDFNGTSHTGQFQSFTVSENKTGADETYQVSLRVDLGSCFTVSPPNTFVVHPEVEAKWDLPDALAPGCSPLDLTIANQSTLHGSPAAVTAVLWEITDGLGFSTSSTGQSITRQLNNNDFENARVFTVSLTATSPNGCNDTKVSTVTVFPPVVPSFNVDILDNCTPVLLGITNASQTSSGSTYNWDWDGGIASGLGGEDYDVVYENNHPTDTENKTISLVLENSFGCTGSFDYSFSVLPEINASVGLAAGSSGQSCGSEVITFVNNSTGGNLNFLWDFDDGQTLAAAFPDDVSHTFINNTNSPLNRVVTLTATNSLGCTNAVPATLPVTIYPRVGAAQSIDITDVCNGTTIDLFNGSTNATVPNSLFSWNFTTADPGGVNLTVNSPADPLSGVLLENNHRTNNVTYSLEFTASTTWNTGLADEHTCMQTIAGNSITAYPILNPVLANSTGPVCSGLTGTEIVFTKDALASSGGPVGGVSLMWDFGDGSSQTTQYTGTSHTFINNSQNDFTSQTRVTATQIVTGCTADRLIDVRVHPRVRSDFALDIPDVCDYPLPVNFVNASAIGAANPGVTTTFDWDYGYSWGGTPQLETLSAGGTHSYSFYNADAETEVDYTVVLTANQFHSISGLTCSNVFSRDLTVYPRVVASLDLASSFGDRVCAPDDISFVNNSTGGALDFIWDFDDGQTFANSVRDDVSHIFANNTNLPFTRVVSLTATNSLGCSNAVPATFPVTVYPRVSAAQSIEITDLCNGTTVDLTNGSTNAAIPNSLFTWEFTTSDTGGTNRTVTSPGDILTGLLLDNSHLTDPVYYDVSFTASTTWDPGTPGEHSCIDLTPGNTIPVYPVLDPLFSNVTGAVCSGLSGAEVVFGKDALSSGGPAGGVSLLWDFGDGNSHSTQFTGTAHTYINNGQDDFTTEARVTATQIATGCIVERVVGVRVHPKVQSDFGIEIPDLCEYPLPVSFTNAALFGADHPGVTTAFAWDYGYEWGGSPQQDILTTSTTHSYSFYNAHTDAVEVYDISLHTSQYHDISGLTCEHIHTRRVEVYPELTADFDISVEEGCNPLTVSTLNNSSGVLSGVYMWDMGDGDFLNVQSPADRVYSHANREMSEIYPVDLLVMNPLGCTKSASRIIEVYPLVTADFFIEDAEGCTPLEVTVRNFSTSTAYNYDWDFGSTHPSSSDEQPGSRIYINHPSGTLDLFEPVITLTTGLNTLIYPESCAETVSRRVTVYPHIYPDFTAGLEGCHPHPVQFANTTFAYGGTDNATYMWDLGNGVLSNEKDRNQSYYNTSFTSDTTFTVWLRSVSEHGCTDSVSYDVVVHPKPRSRMELLSEYVDCSPFDTEIRNLSLGTNLEYHYSFGDGTDSITVSSDNMRHLFRNPESHIVSYNINLLAETEFGCTDLSSQTVYVYPEVTARFDFDPGDAACNPFTVDLLNNSVNAFFYNWDFDDGITSYLHGPRHRFVNNSADDRVFDVSLVAYSEYDCADTYTLPLTVYAAPVANFAIDPPLRVYPETTFDLLNQTYPAHSEWDYSWEFGDGNASSQMHPGSHTYDTWGPIDDDFRYLVSLLVESEHCSDRISHYLIIRPPQPVSDFGANQYEACSPLVVHFENNSMYGETYTWDFGDGNISSSYEPTYTFVDEGYYNVSLRVSGDGGERYLHKVFRVYENPVADFSFSPEDPMLPDARVQFYNLSVGADSYSWDVGDGTIYSDQHPVHTYLEMGEYTVHLEVATEFGCVDTETKISAISVGGKGYLRFPNAFVPNPGGPNGGFYNVADLKNEVFHPVHEGVVKYNLSIFNRWGEQIFESDDINIGWDGYYQGTLSQMDVYVWRAVGIFSNGEVFDMRGNVTLLR